MHHSLFLLLTILGCAAASSPAAHQVSTQASTKPASDRPASVAAAKPAAEDWSKLPVDRAVLKPFLTGVVLAKSDAPTYSRELVRLEWRHGDPIDIYVVKPRGIVKPRVALYLYSFPSDNDRFMDDGWCKRATGAGTAAVGFISAMTGYRIQNHPLKEWFVSDLQESMGSSAHDVQLIIDYLAGRSDLSANQVGMWGQGSGASIAILAAAADPRIAVLDLLNPWGDWPDWLKSSPVVPAAERTKYLTPEFLQSVAAVDPVAYLPRLGGRTIRVQQVMDDEDTPATAKQKIASAVPAGGLAQYKDLAAHREAWKSSGLSAWIASQLSAGAQSSPPSASNTPL